MSVKPMDDDDVMEERWSDDSDLDDGGADAEETKMNRLLDSVGLKAADGDGQVDGYKRRTEASMDLQLSSLAGAKLKSQTFGEGSKAEELKRQVQRMKKNKKTLSTPLSKPAAERVERKIEYLKTKTKISKWDPIVQEGRKAEHRSFPLDRQPLSIATVDDKFSKSSAKQGGLEVMIRNMIKGSSHAERKDNDLSKAEEEAMAAMSLEEARMRRSELQKHRLLMSYHESRCKRQSKIKSKKYHRILNKKKRKQAEKEEAAAGGAATSSEDAVKQAEKIRAEERASLRHRGTGKWSKNRALIAKHDAGTRDKLNEEMARYKELTQRPVHDISEDEDEDDGDENYVTDDDTDTIPLPSHVVGDNPWLSSQCLTEEEAVAEPEKDAATSETNTENDGNYPKDSLRHWLNSSMLGKKEHNVKKFEDAVRSFQEQVDQDKQEEAEKKAVQKAEEAAQQKSVMRETEEVGLNNDGDSQAVVIEQGKKTEVIDLSDNSTAQPISAPVDGDDDTNDVAMTIAEAFADDDVIAEFASGTGKSGKGAGETVVDPLDMPGWGRWDGCGLKAKKRKKRRFVNTATMTSAKLPRKHERGHVFVNEDRDVYAAKHQVSKLPFPFTNSDQFERSLSRPIGATWNTPSVYKQMIKPKVSTVPGAIIQPMHPDAAKAQEKDMALKKKKKAQYHKSKKEKHHTNMANSLDGAKL